MIDRRTLKRRSAKPVRRDEGDWGSGCACAPKSEQDERLGKEAGDGAGYL